ncbi:NADH dehydrogenase I chain G [Thermoplasma volcanium GSS1]|uniref:NADH dehydrogenase I chain G n=1 Tax=Thermoplasma volcanium (strain ATCC 51530 / DSM 4299 / JCM 9571 / NBRC 15438 / GSS1) TaxID=273116 RepID=Q979M6_THEVO|nr:NADH-quinone oxidoreductase subunit J [Thermoplasma volcanium]BAB60276.1 NADH dehydrogenase I chain G [Thermoplasma volcanium GSS1]
MIYTLIFSIIAVFLIAFSVLSVKEKNITHSAIYLFLFLFILAAEFLFLGASFVAAVEILVYIGAVVTLIVFTVMLTGGKEIE